MMAVLPHPGERMLNISVVWPGDPRRGQRVLTPLRKFLKPLEDTIQIRAYLDEQRPVQITQARVIILPAGVQGTVKILAPTVNFPGICRTSFPANWRTFR